MSLLKLKLNLCVGLLCLTLNAIAQGPANDSLLFSNPGIQSEPNSSQPAVRASKPLPKDTGSAPKHSPRKATLLSVFLPGAGQFYNKKYWKIPIVYAAAGASVLSVISNHKSYINYKRAYSERLSSGSNTDAYYAQFQTTTLQSYRDYYRKNLELSYIACGAVYILQIVDAAVDAHFFDFKITEDLSLSITPYAQPWAFQPVQGFLFSLKF